MAESFTTINRFSTTKIIHADFLVMVISPSKRHNCLSAMVMLLTSWIWENVNLRLKKRRCSLPYVVASASL